MAEADIVKSIFLAASRETVWAYLTEKDKLGEWFFRAKADLADGKDYTLMGVADGGAPVKNCWGTVVHMEPPSKLIYSFTITPFEGAMTTVTWTLEEENSGTMLTLTHDGISAAGEAALSVFADVENTWGKFLSTLSELLAN